MTSVIITLHIIGEQKDLNLVEAEENITEHQQWEHNQVKHFAFEFKDFSHKNEN